MVFVAVLTRQLICNTVFVLRSSHHSLERDLGLSLIPRPINVIDEVMWS